VSTCTHEKEDAGFTACHDGTLQERSFSASGVGIRFARRWLSTFLTLRRIPRRAINDAVLASGEAIANSVEHGYSRDRRRRIQMTCYCCMKHNTILIEIADNGEVVQRKERTPDRGFGLTLMRSLAEDVNVLSGGGTVVMLLLRPA
jgi:anti-sigma regulatory factor (Ser/Thr protein kinase)